MLLRQLKKEIEIMQMLSHPNIVTYEGQVETKTKIFCFMELLRGGDLFDYLSEHGPLAQLNAAYLMYGVVSAITHMHDLGIVHRDIKAENLLIVSRESAWLDAKIIDFGFSTIIPKMATTKSFLGTAGYLAPEIQQHRDYSKCVDIWALGVLIYLSLTCRLPFSTEIHDDLPKMDQNSRFELLFSEAAFEGPDTSTAQDLLRHMLETNQSLRYSALQCLKHDWLKGGAFGRDAASASPLHLQRPALTRGPLRHAQLNRNTSFSSPLHYSKAKDMLPLRSL